MIDVTSSLFEIHNSTKWIWTTAQAVQLQL